MSRVLFSAFWQSVQRGESVSPIWGSFERPVGAWHRVCPAIEPFDALMVAVWSASRERRS